jgi:hypothetical protein
MDGFLRDPIWQFVGAIISLVAVVFSIVLPVGVYFKQRRRKALSYDVSVFADVLTVGGGLKGKIQVLYQGTPVDNIRLMVVRIYNDGNVPIVQADWDEHLTVSFGKEATLLTVEILETKPKEVNPQYAIESGALGFEPFLLNPGDSFTMKFLVARAERKPGLSVKGRIVGVSEIKKKLQVGMSDGSLALISLMIGSFSMTIYGISVLLPQVPHVPTLVRLLAAILFLSGEIWVMRRIVKEGEKSQDIEKGYSAKIDL